MSMLMPSWGLIDPIYQACPWKLMKIVKLQRAFREEGPYFV